MDILHEVHNWMDHNRWLTAAIVVFLIATMAVAGCQPKTTSLLDPELRVTPAQLDREWIIVLMGLDNQAAVLTDLTNRYNRDVETAKAQLAAANKDLEAQIAQRQRIFEAVAGFGTVLTQGGFTTETALGSLLSIGLGLGTIAFGLDSRRKSAVIGDLKAAIGAGEPASTCP